MEITANDEPTEIEADVDKRFSSIVVNLPVQQTGTGTPSPSNPRPFAVWTDVSLYVSDTTEADEPTLTIQLPTPMYGGKVDMVRGEIATLYNSKESGTDWEMTQEGQFRCQVSAYNNGDETSTNVADLYAVHYETVSNKDAYDATDDLTCGLATIDGTTYLYVNDAQYTTMESFATHIADEVFVFRAHIPMSDVTEPHIVYLPEGTSYVWAEGALIEYTVTGAPPLSLTNSMGKPLESWSVELLPKQDLNGYDAPWPAGGGANKYGGSALKSSLLAVTGATEGSDSNGSFVNIPASTALNNVTLFDGFEENQQYTIILKILPTGNAAANVRVYYTDNTYNAISASADGALTTVTYTTLAGKTVSGINLGYWYTSTCKVYYDDCGVFVGANQPYAPYSNICPIYGTDKLTITTAGKNLCDNSTNIYGGYYGPAGTWNPSEDIASSELIPVMPNTTYVASVFDGQLNRINGCVVTLWSSESIVTQQLLTDSFTTAQDTKFVRIRNYQSEGSYIRAGNYFFQLEAGNTPTAFQSYLPISSNVITLPSTVYTATIGSEGGESRWGEVDLGTLTYTKSTFNNITYYTVDNTTMSAIGCKPVSYRAYANALCEQYKLVPSNGVTDTFVDNSFFIWIDSRLYIRNDACSTVEELVSAVTGVKLVYELIDSTQFAITTPTIPTPTGTATTWATAEDGTVDSMTVTYIGKA